MGVSHYDKVTRNTVLQRVCPTAISVEFYHLSEIVLSKQQQMLRHVARADPQLDYHQALPLIIEALG